MAACEILFYNHTAEMSGAEYVLMDVLDGLDRSRFAPVLACPAGALADAMTARDVPWLMLPALDARFGRGIGGLISGFRSMLGAATPLRRLLKARHPALVHANSVRAGLVATGAARGLKLPVVWHIHDILPENVLSRVIRRAALRSSNTHLLAVSQATADSFAGKLHRKKPVTVIYNSVDVKRYRANAEERARVRKELCWSEDETIVGLVGQLTPRKRQVEGVTVFARKLRERKDVRLMIIGGAQFHPENLRYQHQLEVTLEEVNAGGQIQFLGPRKDVAALLQGMDLLLSLPDQEPLGLTLMEAAATELPVVATRVGGIPEVVEDGGSGLLAPPDNLNELMQHVEHLASDNELRIRLGRAGCAIMEQKFTPAIQRERMRGYYESLLKNSPDRGDR